MQFTNTSGVTSQTDTNQHNAGGELHARLRNDEQHTSTPGPAGVEGLEDLTAAQVGGGGACQHTNDKPDRLEAATRPAGPGRGAGGWRQGQGGYISDTVSQAPHEHAQANKKPTSVIGCRPVVEVAR